MDNNALSTATQNAFDWSSAKQNGFSDADINDYVTRHPEVNVLNKPAKLDIPAADTATPDSANYDTSGFDQSDPWGSFVQTAAKVAKEQDYPLSVLLGQAALESGHGTAAPGNNYFGIKGSGDAGSGNYATQEADANGNYYGENDNFAAYSSPEASIRAYIDLIKNNYPDAYAVRNNPDQMIQAIKGYGYATDPTYVQQVENTPEYQQFANAVAKTK